MGASRTRLVHITTVPMSLNFLRGQVSFMRERGVDIFALSSPGEELNAFGASNGVPVDGVEMPRRITPLKDMVAICRIAQRLRDIRPQLVHGCGGRDIQCCSESRHVSPPS